jgi:hypothetical protein
MSENFKEKIKEPNQPDKTESFKLPPEVEAKLREQGLDPETVTLDELLPEKLDKEGNDLSLMSAFEVDIWVTFCRTRHYLATKYPVPKQADTPDKLRAQEADDPPQIEIAKAREDPKSKVYLEALNKMVLIYDKLHVLQTGASRFEKICLRYYSYITYNWIHASDVEEFRSQLTDMDLFETVDAYFKICKKHNVPTLEEPYYFLPLERRLELKLEGDMLKRMGSYSENEIRISILEGF